MTLFMIVALSAVPAARVASAQDGPPSRDIDLVVEKNLPFLSQMDYRWSGYPVADNSDFLNVTIGQCGCLVSNYATMATFYMQGTSLPLFPWLPIGGNGTQVLSFSPRYIDLYLRDRFKDSDGSSGYKKLDDNTCGTIPKPWALRNIAFPQVSGISPTGLNVRMKPWGYEQMKRVWRELEAGNPVVIGVELRDDQGRVSHHSQIIVGWEMPNAESSIGKFKILDPLWRYGLDGRDFRTSAKTPGGDDEAYVKWRNSIERVFYVSPAFSNQKSIAVYDDPSPVEILVIAPDGRRTGFEPALGRTVEEDPSADYFELGGWSDPFGVVPPGRAAKFLQVNEPAEGTYRFLVTGTGQGQAKLAFSSIDGSSETVLLKIDAPIAPGQSLKYEMHYSPVGSTVQQVTAFTPEARLDVPVHHTNVDVPVAFDGGASYDLVSTIVSYHWDFGDGSSANGPTGSHAYSLPGEYTATLTVTNAAGATDTAESHVFAVDPSAPLPTATTEMVSVSNTTGQPSPPTFYNPLSFDGSISDDGRYVAFWSGAQLSEDDLNPSRDIYVRDLVTRRNTRISVPGPGQAPNGISYSPSISRDGRFVAFVSEASNLVAGDANGTNDVFVVDRQTGGIELVTLSSTGEQGHGVTACCPAAYLPVVSDDGRFIAFESVSTNLVPGAFPTSNIYVRDRLLHTTELVSVSSSGNQGTPICNFFGCTYAVSVSPAISADGHFVAFESSGRDLVPNDFNGLPDVFVRDRQTSTTIRVSLSDTGAQLSGGGFRPSISADGRFVTFSSGSDVFVRDLQTLHTERVSVSTGGQAGNGVSSDGAISSDGRYVAFHSTASNLVLDDTNGATDVFLRDRVARTTVRVNVTSAGAQTDGLGSAGGYVDHVSVSLGGSVVFGSQSAQFGYADTNGIFDVFVRTNPLPAPPTAVAGGPYAGWANGGPTPSYITFDGTGSFDPRGAPLTARWDFGDGTPEVVVASTLRPQHTYAAGGNYLARLIVNNGAADSAPSVASVQVLDPAPAAPLVTLTTECASSGDPLSVFLRSPLVSTGGGRNLGSGVPPPTALAQPLTVLPVTFSGPPGDASVDGSVENVSIKDGVEITTALQTTVPALDPAQYQVGTPGATSAPLVTPCPPGVNRHPTADAGGPYHGLVGSPVTLDGSASEDPQGATLSYAWLFGDSATGDGVAPQHTYQAAGRYFVSLEVNNGANSSLPEVGDRSFALVVVEDIVPVNQPPVADAGTAYEGSEGSAIPLSGATASDPDADALTRTWSVDSPLCGFSDASALNPSLTCTDNGHFAVTLTVSDGKAAPVSSTASVDVANANPMVTAVSVPLDPRPIGTVAISAPFTDAGVSDTHSCTITWDDGASAVAGTMNETPGSGAGTCSGSRVLTAGVYVVTVKVTDDDTGFGTGAASTLIVVYDPNAGFVTGGGWFTSAPGADKANSSATGRANFGFVAKYKQGAKIPDGETEFQFKEGDLDFHSTAYQWLVVTGGCYAQYKGTGTINGVAGYEFLLTLRDGQLCSSVGADAIRMKITSAAGLRYDNKEGPDDIGSTTGNVQQVDAGSIVLRRQ